MSLTLIGRYLLPHTPLVPCQDPDDLNTFYYLAAEDRKVYKITWGGAPVLLADTSTALAAATMWSKMSVIAKNASTFFGMLDETYHFAFAFSSGAGGTLTGIVDVNVVSGAFTVGHPFADLLSGAMWDSSLYVKYAESGTIFYLPCQYVTIGKNYISWGQKRYGETTSQQSALQDTDLPCSREAVIIDDISSNLIYTFVALAWRITAAGSFTASGTPLTYSVLPDEGVDYAGFGAPDWYSHVACSTVPKIRRMWDDNWVYGFGAATGFHLLYFKKNLVTGQYQVAEMVVPNPPGQVTGANPGTITSENSDQAFDMWQTGADATKRRIFFSYNKSEKVHTSLAWPPVVTDALAIDSPWDSNKPTNVLSIHTANEYVYAFHTGGTLYGNCLSKIMESELIAGPATPSIGGIGARLLFKDKRVFFIGVPGYGKYLWWGQPMEPQALDVGWDGFNTTVFDDEDNTSLNALDDNVYVGSQKGFIRLRGKSPDSWVLDQTLATTGPLSDKTSSVTPFGLIYPRENGLWLFNGFTSVLFFEKGKNLLANVNWDQYARAFSLWDGRYYRLYYPSGTAIENNRELVVDLIGGIENARGTEGDRAATFGFADLTTNTIYLGDASGNLMTLGGTAALRSFSLTTKEYPCGAGLMEAGSFSALHYDIDLAGATLSIIPICDGVEKDPITITNATRTRSKVSLPKGNFYRMGFRFEITTAAAVKFYDPWYLE